MLIYNIDFYKESVVKTKSNVSSKLLDGKNFQPNVVYCGRRITLFFVFLQFFVLRLELLGPHPLSFSTLLLLVFTLFVILFLVACKLPPLGSSTALFGGK